MTDERRPTKRSNWTGDLAGFGWMGEALAGGDCRPGRARRHEWIGGGCHEWRLQAGTGEEP